MKIEMVSVASLRFDDQNARIHPPENRAMLRASLEKFGQRKPIVTTSDNTVIAGNGTLLAASELGWDKVAIVRAPEDWSEEMIRAYAIADNRSADLSEFDPTVLQSQLAALEIAEFEFDALGFSEAEMIKLATLDGTNSGKGVSTLAEWTGMPEYEQEERGSAFSCTVHFPDDEAKAKFFELLGVNVKKSFWWPESDGLVGSTQHEHYVVDNPA
jgi:hypothetical protein